jgi:hypothetical protein
MSFTPHTGVYVDVDLSPAEPGADYCEDFPLLDEFDVERDRGADPAVRAVRVYAWIAPRGAGETCTLRVVRLDGAVELCRAAIVAPGVAVVRDPTRWALWRWVAVSTLTGSVLARGHKRRDAVADYWHTVARQWAPADWSAAHVLQAAARRLARAPLGGEVRA